MAKSRRKLTVILSADVSGFTRLMEADEATTVRALKECQQVFRERIERDHGRVRDTTGDALLAEFTSAVDAVECASRLQAELGRRQQSEPPERRMLHRIGVNLGDVLDDGKSLFGDGVNIAARLEALAEPGGLCISGKVFDEVAGKVKLDFESLGEQRLKNIRNPIRVYRYRATAPLSVRVLGELELRRGGRIVDLPQSRKTRALLAYLIVTARPQRRERLCSIFWDVADDPRAALRWSLSKLRPLVDEPDLARIDTAGGTVRFDVAGACVDLFDAREALAANDGEGPTTDRLVDLVAGFRGPFLDGLELSDFLEFQAWLISLREEARLLQARALRALIARLSETPEEALPHARDLASVDAFDESAQATLVSLLVACGRRREAEQHAQVAEQLLRQVDPGAGAGLRTAIRRATSSRSADAIARSPVTLDQAIHNAAPPVKACPATGELIGRVCESERIAQALEATRREQRLLTLLLIGEPGIGKSHLLGALQNEAERQGGTVLAGSAYEAEASRPYGPWIDALRRVPAVTMGDALASELAPLLPGRGSAGEEGGGRERVFGAVVELIAARAHSAPPVVLMFDDVQWCDEASAELLHYVARMNRHRPVLIAVAARNGELQDNDTMRRALRSLRHQGAFEEIELTALSEEETFRLTEGTAPAEQLARVFEESAGNPLFALEVARSLPYRREAVPSTLRRLVRDRVDRLPIDAADVLRWAAVIGHTFEVRRLSEVAPIDPDRLVAALEALERFAMLRVLPAVRGDAGSYAFAHDIVRQVVYEELSEPRRRLMHLRVADLLRAHGEADEAVAADLAHHAAQAGEHEIAARACLRAARRCLRMFGGAEANGLARRGMHHAEQIAEPERVKLLLELAEVRYGAHRPREPQAAARVVEDLARQALDLGCTEHARLGFHIASYIRWEGGDWSDAQRHMLRAEQLSRTTEGRDRVVALGEAARCLALLERDLGQAEALALEAEGLSAQIHFESASVADAVGMLRLHEGRLEEAAKSFERARDLSSREQDHLGEFRTLEHLVMVELERKRFDRARALCDDLIAIGERLREGSEAPQAKALAALSRYATSEESEDELEAALASLRSVDAKQRLAYVLRVAAEVDLGRDRGDKAGSRAQEALDLARVLARSSDVVLARVALARAARLFGDAGTFERERTALRAELLAGVSSQARTAVRGLLTANPNIARRK